MKLIDILVQHEDEIAERGEATNYFAMDPDGRVFGYQAMPEPNIVGWSVPGIKNSTDGYGCLVQVNPIDVKESWQECIVSLKQYESALAASKTEWDGEGLPPIGMDIEYKFTNVSYRSYFSRGKVLAYGIQNVFMEHWSSKNEFIQPLDKIEFRPIRSEADKKRDEVIEALKEGLGHAHGLFDLMQIYHLLKDGKIPHIRID